MSFNIDKYMKKLFFKHNQRAFSLIEAIISVFVLATVSLAIAGSFVSAVKSVTYTKNVVTAAALGNEEMEALHNLSYDNLATQSGTVLPLPANPLPDSKTVTWNNIAFKVDTVITYYDDPADNLAPTDTDPHDYKKISITISLADGANSITTLSTNISEKLK